MSNWSHEENPNEGSEIPVIRVSNAAWLWWDLKEMITTIAGGEAYHVEK